MRPSGFRGSPSASSQNARARLQARLETKRENAKIDALEKLIHSDSEFVARLSTVYNPIQRSRIYQEYYDSHLEEITRMYARIDSGRPVSPVRPSASTPPAEPSAPRPPAEASSSRTPTKPSSSRTPAEANSPRTPAEPSSSRTSAEPSSPRTPAEATSPRIPVKPSSPRIQAEPSSPRTPAVASSSLPPAEPSSSRTQAEASSSRTPAEPSSPGAAGSRQPTEESLSRPNEMRDLAERLSLGTVQSKSTGPIPTGWSLNEARPRSKRQLSNKVEKKANLFMNYIRQGFSPTDAASKLGPGSMLRQLRAVKSPNPSVGQYEIRLNHHDRLTFLSDEVAKKVTILEIGGHT